MEAEIRNHDFQIVQVKSNLLILQVSVLFVHNRSSNEAFAIAYVSTKGLFSSALIFSENKKFLEAVAVHT